MSKKFFALMVLGPPGSGKGTQIKLLADKFGFNHFISSQIGRDYISSHNDAETIRQKERYEKGLLFDERWMFDRVKEKTEEIFKQGLNNGIIYDGSPRTLYEADKLYNFLAELIGKGNLRIIEIRVSEEEIIKRLEKRLICGDSSEHVFIRSEKLFSGSSCPECGGILKERDLDKKEVIKIRLEEYKNKTLPGLEFLKKNHDVLTINGEQNIEEVHKEIMRKLIL